MENINDVLKSDLLQRYVAGDVNSDEKMRVDNLLIHQPEIRRAVHALKNNMVADKSSVSNIKQLNPTSGQTKSDKSFLTRFLAYAGCIGLGGLIVWAVMNPKLNQANRALESTEKELTVILEEFNELSDMYAFLNAGATQPYMLRGDTSKKEAEVIVYWNQEREKAMLRVVNLPSIKSNQTYQIWADIDGNMYDLGTIDPATAIVDPVNIKYVSDPSALSLTIEPDGGSPQPTLRTLTASVKM